MTSLRTPTPQVRHAGLNRDRKRLFVVLRTTAAVTETNTIATARRQIKGML